MNIKTRIENFLGLKISLKNKGAEQKEKQFKSIFVKYESYTMIPEPIYIENLKLVQQAANIKGNVYECGVWKGGTIAGIAEILGNEREYYLFDSFEGLPPAKAIDGDNAIEWQQKQDDLNYFDNCSAEEKFATEAMNQTKVKYHINKGWFNESLPLHKPKKPIAVLRLDGDWYDSTMDCLKYLYPHVNDNGLIILDDYYAWDGCSRAVHDYLSSISSASRLHTSANGVAYIIKKDKYGN